MHFTVRKQPYYTDKGSQFLLHTSVTGGRICVLLYISIVPGMEHSVIWVHSCNIFIFSKSLFSPPSKILNRHLVQVWHSHALWLANVLQAASDGKF